MEKKLIGKTIGISDLSDYERDRMFELMVSNYDGVHRYNFDSDLSEKSDVILLTNGNSQIQGFSTLMVLEELVRGVKTKALFSGDTIIDRKYWGTTELEHQWGIYAFDLIDQHPGVPLFWFLLSKGYKTYRFLPVFFNEFYPRHDREIPQYEQEVLDTFAIKKFQGRYNPRTGLIVFDGDKDRLKQGIADIDEARLTNPHIRYFLERNPNWNLGDELACIVPLTKANFNRMGHRVVNKNKS